MQILFFGANEDFIDLAFYNENTPGFDVDVVQASSTRLVVENQSTGVVTTLTGSGLPTSETAPPSGTLTGMEVRQADGTLIATVTDVSWSFAAFDAALENAIDNDNSDDLDALLSLQPVTFDARQSTTPTDVAFDGTGSDVTLLGSNFGDTLQGGPGDDSIRPGASDRGELVIGSGGNDTIDFSGHSSNAWAEIAYYDATGPVQISINGAANTGSVAKSGGFTDTILDVRNPLQGNGLTLTGGAFGDTFTVNGGAGGTDSWMQVLGGGGDDTFNLTLTDTVRLSFAWGTGTRAGGATVNVGTGVISADGYGGTDSLSLAYNGGRLEVEGTNFGDAITGSGASERFILRGGNDTLDAGAGYDVLRFDRGGSTAAVAVDLANETASGEWENVGFSHSISNVEEIWGTEFNDTLLGSAGNDGLWGADGDDSLEGFDGSDRLWGGNGNDYLNPGDSTDYDIVDPGAGNDTVDASDMDSGFLQIEHWSLVNSAAQVFDINGQTDVASISKGAGNGTTTIQSVSAAMQADGLGLRGSAFGDTFNITVADDGWTEVKGGRGNDTYNLGASVGSTLRLSFDRNNYNDAATQGVVLDLSTGIVANDGFGGQDSITGMDNIRVEVRASNLADRLTGSALNDRFISQGGNDTVDGGDGFDTLRYDRNDMTSGIKVDIGAGTVLGNWNNVGFLDTISNIEEIRATDFADQLVGDIALNSVLRGYDGDDGIFADGFSANYAPTIANQVYRLYEATLGRAPDVGGHSDWTLRIASGELALVDAAGGFVGSREFQNTYGNLNNTEFVELLYGNVLNRAADAGGLSSWVGQLDGGTTKQAVVLGFSESREFQNNTNAAATAYASNSDPASWSDDVFRLYQATLGRNPDEGGFMSWTENLSTGSTLVDASGGFVNSREFQNTYGSLNDTEFVELLYQNVLNRAADTGGLATWTGELAGGTTRAEVVLGFSQSQEFRNNTTADLKTWIRGLGDDDRLQGGSGVNALAGGMLCDTFVFDQDDDGIHQVLDLEVWDILRFEDFGYQSAADVRAQMSQVGTDVVFSDQGVSVTLFGTQLSSLTDDMLTF